MKHLLLAVALASAGLACATTPEGPYDPATESTRNTYEAQRLSKEAADLIAEDPARAEQLLRDALTADLFYGPAHNNLGVLYLKQGKLYEAANEFEWARKLMPGHPDPRLNLALTLEEAGQLDEAIQTYETALAVYPGHVPTLQALARVSAAELPGEPRTRELLEQITLKGESPGWRDWARKRLLMEPATPPRSLR